MNAFHRLSPFGSTVNERASLVRKSAVLQFERGLRWLKLRPQAAFFAAGVSVVVLLLIFSGVTAAVAAVAAWIALMRHFAQIDADRQRRITESFSKAVEQLGSDKLEVRLGGVYSLERISKESPDDYWTVMENLTAFVRERSRRNEVELTSQDFEQRVSRSAYFGWLGAGKPNGQTDSFWEAAVTWERFGEPPATDIAAVLTVIKRRSERGREREDANDWHLNLSGSVLRRAQLSDAHLEGAYLIDTNLKGALLHRAHLEGAELLRANLELAVLRGAHLKEAILFGANLEHAVLRGAHLKGADLTNVTGLSETQLQSPFGDASTQLPQQIARPRDWPAQVAEPDGTPPHEFRIRSTRGTLGPVSCNLPFN